MPKTRAILVLPILALFLRLPAAPGADFPGAAARSAGEDAGELTDVLLNGTLEDLAAECRRRGLSGEGDALALRRRLVEDRRGEDTGFAPGPPGQGSREGDTVLEHADFIELSEDERGNAIVRLSGDVRILFAGKEIRADEAYVNAGRRIVTGRGGIRFTDKEKEYRAEGFVYDASTDEGFFTSAETRIGAFTYTGATIRKLPAGDKIEGEGVTLTTCDLEDPHYRIEGGSVSLYDGHRALLEDAKLYYGSVAVVRLPYATRRLEERTVKSSVSFRERSGLTVQNTFYPLRTDAKQLVLKGDFYQRLGLYAGGDFASRSETHEVRLGASGALGNDIYNEADFGKQISGTWTPLGPPSASVYSIDRDFRYRVYLNEKFRWGALYYNTLALDLGWISDPYYSYDFERRSEQLDLFSLLGSPQFDYPRVGKGFSWAVDDTLVRGNFSAALKNRVKFEPQRNGAETYVTLPDYYEYRIYALTTPEVAVSHSARLLDSSRSAVFSAIDYRSLGRYKHTAYFDENEVVSSELHEGDASVRFAREYPLGRAVKAVPSLEVGAQGQSHVDPTAEEAADDDFQTLLYGRTTDELALGGEGLSFSLTYDLKYKLLGPDDLYEFGSFRVHELRAAARSKVGFFSDTLTTFYDLRPRYDWVDRTYEGSVFERERFAPLVNTLSINPVKSLTVSDRLVYDIAAGRMKTNVFGLNYASRAVYLGRCELKASWDLAWEHNFPDPFLDTFSSVFGVEVKPNPRWAFSFSVLSRNDEFWRYFSETALDPENPENPLLDLLKSFNFFNREDREDSNFKLRSVSVGFTRDLHDWVLTAGYRGNVDLSYDLTRYEWNNTISLGLSLKNVREGRIGVDFSERR